MSKRDYYEVLGVPRSVGEQELKSAYRKLALKYHPDRNPDDRTAEERFKEAAEAYGVLADPDKRARYDKFGHAGVAGAGSPGFDPATFRDFNDIFGNLGDMFGFGDIFGSGRQRRGPRRGNGRVSRERRLKVKVPAGIDTGQQLRLQGEGEHGPRGGEPGDLYVVIHVQDHPVFRREGSDLLCAIPVSYPTLVLGGTITVPTLNGDETLHVPKGTQGDARLRLRGKGLPHVAGRGHGDLYIDVKVAVPTSVSQEQKTLIEDLDRIMPQRSFEPNEHGDGDGSRPFFSRVKDIFG